MPRPKTFSRETIVAAAMDVFWRRGFAATSMDDLVRETKISRAALYSVFPGKQALFLACLDAYGEAVVSAAFAPVEAQGASLAEVAAYYEAQIEYAERLGLPGPGCLMANSMTERAPHDPEALARVRGHNARLEKGFLNALSGEAEGLAQPSDPGRLASCAASLTVFTNGLWSTSRQEQDGETLRQSVREMLSMVKERMMR